MLPQKFIINQDCLIQFLGENENRYLWKYFKNIEKTESCIYMFLDRGAALYIPRHAFESEEKYESFYESLKYHVSQNC